MPSKQTAVVLALFLLLVAVGYGLYRTTGDDGASLAALASTASANGGAPIDERSLATAQLLVRLPTTRDERPLADDALRLGDKEMDLGFADAVRDMAMHPQTSTPELRTIAARLRASQSELATDQARIAQLTAASERAAGSVGNVLNDQLDLAKAHLELVRDEVDDASQDLMRLGGDPQGRMQAMMREHEALSKSSDSTRINLVPVVDVHGLVRHLRTWAALDTKQDQLAQAKVAADSAALGFSQRHDALEASLGSPGHDSAHSLLTHAASAALLLDTQRRAVAQKTRGTLDQHVDNQHHLADVYTRWIGVVDLQKRHAINRILRATAVILCIALIGLLIDRWFEQLLGTMSMDRRRTQTMYMVLRVTLQVIAVILILLVIFGMPDNLGTFLGLAGAGLTVALKDFILSFFGWFVLMGRDGIGIGDLVEINGVTGEVLEIGIFHTMLLETGNWADTDHPTGRRVTFSNSFAIERHYFNFSTNGRWLWDELRFVVPTGRDPSPLVDTLQRQVETLTADSASRAAVELKGARRAPRLSALSAAPAIYIKPIVGGIEVTVRYLTHLRERGDIRSRLYETVIALLAEKPAALASSASS